MKNFNRLLLKRVDKSINFIVLFSSLIAFMASWILNRADLPSVYAILNFSIGVLLFALFLNAKRVQTASKLMVLIVVIAFIAIASFIGGGFTSAYLTLLMLSNILAVLFLTKTQSVVISISSIFLMFGLCYYSLFLDQNNMLEEPVFTWSLQIISYTLFIVVIQLAVYTMKTYLVENIKGLEKAVSKANQLAYYDQLTHLPNTFKFKEEVEAIIEERKCNGVIVFFNLKSLNLINSTLGHSYGDQALIEATRIFMNIKTDTSIIARTSGNEFAIWKEGIVEEDLIKKFDIIMSELKTESIISKKKLEFYAAYAKLEYGRDTFESCYRKAALTLTYVKNNNLRDFIAYDNKIEEDLRRKELIKDYIERALEREEITLVYQAKHDSRNGKVVGVEGLARWQNEELGIILPMEFIPVIESLNMAMAFGEFVIQRACRDFKKLQEKYGEEIGLSINISPSHIREESIIQTLKHALEINSVPGQRLTIEITEDIIIEGIETVGPILRQLRAQKLKISLDDFGTGYSSLNYLTLLELDELKIDKSFIDQIEHSDNIHILLENIIRLSKQLNLDVVAEGVERQEQKDLLSQLNCYVIQGYYYAKPETLE